MHCGVLLSLSQKLESGGIYRYRVKMPHENTGFHVGRKYGPHQRFQELNQWGVGRLCSLRWKSNGPAEHFRPIFELYAGRTSGGAVGIEEGGPTGVVVGNNSSALR